MRVRLSVLPIAFLALIWGCSDSKRVALFLKTDLAGVAEFATVESSLLGDGPSREVQVQTVERVDYARGVLVAEFEVSADATLARLELVMRAPGGAELVRRPIAAQLASERQSVTVLIDRDCEGVTCADAGAPACLGGRCVEETCVEGDPSCGALECTLDDECVGGSASCAEPRCVSGVCFVAARSDACSSSEYCDIQSGCRAIPERVAADAGMSDVGSDADATSDGDASDDAASETDADGGPLPECINDEQCEAPTDGIAVCVEGACVMGCGDEVTLCGSACINLSDSESHCGECFNSCGAGNECVNGSCVPRCDAPSVMCGDACVDTESSLEHCGDCEQACTSGMFCSAGMCTLECDAPRTVCARSCVSTESSMEHCGECDNACDPGLSCIGGSCSCTGGRTFCDGECVNTATSNSHCGGCGSVCTGTSICMGGDCVPDCPGATVCGSSCVDVETDELHCGECDERCASDARCLAGTCVAPSAEKCDFVDNDFDGFVDEGLLVGEGRSLGVSPEGFRLDGAALPNGDRVLFAYTRGSSRATRMNADTNNRETVAIPGTQPRTCATDRGWYVVDIQAGNVFWHFISREGPMTFSTRMALRPAAGERLEHPDCATRRLSDGTWQIMVSAAQSDGLAVYSWAEAAGPSLTFPEQSSVEFPRALGTQKSEMSSTGAVLAGVWEQSGQKVRGFIALKFDEDDLPGEEASDPAQVLRAAVDSGAHFLIHTARADGGDTIAITYDRGSINEIRVFDALRGTLGPALAVGDAVRITSSELDPTTFAYTTARGDFDAMQLHRMRAQSGASYTETPTEFSTSWDGGALVAVKGGDGFRYLYLSRNASGVVRCVD